MDVHMNKKSKLLHDELIEELEKLPYIHFKNHDYKDKVFHITISSKKIQKIYDELWEYVNNIPCDFDCKFDNVSVFKWEDNTWKLYKEYLMDIR